MKRNTLISLLFPFLFLSAVATANEVPLPELGDSSATALTPEQEQQIGGEVVRRMRQGGYIMEDPLISSYIKDVGRSLAVHAPGNHDFTFFVVDAPGINAFALPGGYIGIHSGLILASRNESELAGVIAHEISHVTQHHLARGVEQANRMNLPITVALLAAILLSGGDPNVANASIAAGMGGSAQMQLNFSRAHEHEADRVGMQLLASSEFDPQGMADFFQRLQEESRYYGESVPEFLSTHPVTTSRLAEAQAAAEQYPRINRIDATAYLVARAKVRLHHHKNASTLLKELDAGPEATGEEQRYLKAITLMKLQRPEEAQRGLRQLISTNPDSIAYRHTLGELYLRQGELKEAHHLYQQGLKRYPGNELLSLSQAETLIAMKQYQTARELLQRLLRLKPGTTPAYRQLAQLEAASGNTAASHIAQAQYYLQLGEPFSAMEQLKLAKRAQKVDFYHASRIEALNLEIQERLDQIQAIPVD